MTSTADGLDGASFSYLHRSGILAGAPHPHMTVLGGDTLDGRRRTVLSTSRPAPRSTRICWQVQAD
jgi:hypothetical protein